jgi:hypothetical protein
MRGPSLLDYLRNPQAHRDVPRIANARPTPGRPMSAATLPRRRAPERQQPMGPTGYLSRLENPPAQPAPVMSFADANGQDARPMQDEQFDQWQSRTGPHQTLSPFDGGGDQFADARPIQNTRDASYYRDPQTAMTQTEIGPAKLPPVPAAMADILNAQQQGPTWAQASLLARQAMARENRVQRPGLFARLGIQPQGDPMLDALRARSRPITRPE